MHIFLKIVATFLMGIIWLGFVFFNQTLNGKGMVLGVTLCSAVTVIVWFL